MKCILIIEEEESLARFLEIELVREGYKVVTIGDGRQGLDTALDPNKNWGMVILDLILPDLNGFEVCRRIRQQSAVPIILTSTNDTVMDRVSGLEYGADDYIVKPFAIEELLARVRALFRRVKLERNRKHLSQEKLIFKDLTLEKGSRSVKRGDEIIQLTKREYELLLDLITHVDKVRSRSELLQSIWGYDSGAQTNVVDVYIRYLRDKIDHQDEDSYIQTVRGIGYVLRN